MNELVPALRHELASIEADVSKLEAEAAKVQARLRLALDKADKLKAVLALYADEPAVGEQPRLFVSGSFSTNATVRAPKERIASKGALVKAEVTSLLSARGVEHRTKILEHLVSKGLMGHEKTPLASLAAYLSDNKELFVADGRGNFSLRREGQREPPPAPERDAGSAEGTGIPVPSNLNPSAKGASVS